MPKVSVIIPAYNVSKYIARCLESVLNQGYPDLEIIIVDDGSRDDLESVLQKYTGDKRIRCIKTPNRGVSRALNTGIKSSTGDYVCFLHADDIFRPGKIKRQVASMEESPACGVSYNKESYFLDGTEKSIESPYFHFTGDIFYFLKRNNFIHASTVMFRRGIIDDISFDEGLACHEDWDLFLKLSKNGVKFLYIDAILTDVSVRPANLSADTGVMDATRAEVGGRARTLWKEFKKDVNICSVKGFANIRRYFAFKAYAVLIGFPKREKFHARSPREILSGKIC